MATLIITKIDTTPELDPYHRDTHTPTKTVLTFDPRDCTLSIDQEYDDNSTPSDVWHGLVLSAGLAPAPTEKAARWYLDKPDAQALINRIVEGHESHWDGSNFVGSLTGDAEAAWHDLIDGLCSQPENDWSLQDTGDWLQDSQGVTADTTNAEIERRAEEIRLTAEMEHVVLDADPANYLYQLRADDYGDTYIDTAMAARLLEMEVSHVRRMILNDRIRARKHGRDWLIALRDIDGITRQKLGRPRNG